MLLKLNDGILSLQGVEISKQKALRVARQAGGCRPLARIFRGGGGGGGGEGGGVHTSRTGTK